MFRYPAPNRIVLPRRQPILLFIGCLLAACTTVPPADTPSGHLEVTLMGVRTECVRSVFLNLLVNGGYAIHKATDTQIVGGQRTQNFGASVLFGTSYGGAPEERVTILFIPQGRPDVLRVVLSSVYVSNQGTAFEKTQPISSTQKGQDDLMASKFKIEQKCRKK